MIPPPDYDTYEQDWKKVDSLVSKGLPQSALNMVDAIYDKSQKEDNHPQYIKAILYKIKLKSDFEEEFIEKIIQDMQLQIAKAETPVKQILHSITADIYWRYYQANRYKFLDRTTAVNIEKEDIRTWDLKTLLNEVINNYQASLENSDELKITDLKAYDVILETTKESKKYRPTLYDFLAHRAVDFFMNDESSIIQPVYKFELDKEEYFSKALTFSKLKLETRDSLSLKFYAMQILQDLIGFHLNDEEPTAMVDVNLKRLKFVHQNSILPLKDSLYLNRLEQMENRILAYPSSTEVSYEIAKAYQNKGRQYKPLLISDQYKWETKKAYEKCQEAIKRFPESDGAQNCRVLLSQIEKPDLQLKVEGVYVPQKPSLSFLEFRNTPKVFFKLINLEHGQYREITQNYRINKELLDKYNSLPAFTTWDIDLPGDGDFQKHATEIKIPELPLGFFVLLACNDQEFNTDSNYFASTTFWVSNISYISQDSKSGTKKFFVMDRTSGIALEGVTAQVFYKNYNYQSRSYEYVKGDSFISDGDGFIEIPAQQGNSGRNSFFIEFTKGNEKLVTGERYYHSAHSPAEEKKQTKTWLFTDRAIYRPGQTIYFKGIVIDKLGNNYEIKQDYKTTVEFYNVNYQKISEFELVTNEYGSFNGSFIAPKGVLNGNMTIRNNTGSINISVEEYKRPKFEVVFNPVQGSYKLNENVQVTGNAKAYAGSNIDNASVKFRVLRHLRLPYRYWAYDIYPGQPTMEIINGTTNTNENGEFTIEFKAIPDHTVSSKYNPVFFYRIFADITDMNGETQSATTEVGVGYTALGIKFGIEETIEKNDLKDIKIVTANWNGQPVLAKGKITFTKLKEPERLLRDKKWGSVPDIQIISKEDYIKYFPLDAYGNEGRMDKLQEESVVETLDFDTGSDSIITLSETAKWKAGRYAVNVQTTDSYGEKVELTKYFTLFSKDAKKPPVNEINWFHILKEKGEPGENAAIIIGTKDKNVRVLYEVTYKEKTISRQWLKLSDEQRKIEIPILEEYRGGFKVNVVFVKHSRSFNNSFNVHVSFANKELEFEFLTFRDKLIPGQQEEWRIKIKGKKGDLVAAELLASMYDASLDILKSNRWNFHLYDKIYSHNSWSSMSAFGSHQSNFYLPQTGTSVQSVFRNYDQLNWFGFNYFGGWPRYRKGIVADGDVMYDQQVLPGQGLDMEAEEQASGENDNKAEEDTDQEVSSWAATTGGGKLGKDEDFTGLQIRRDFRETAFFYPALHTNEAGNIEISFTIPESLTKWKLMGLAHSKDLEYGMFEKEIVTQKDLMVMPNPPRFFREGDKIFFTAKIVNLTENALSGEAKITFFDTRTMEDITDQICSDIAVREFEVAKGKSDMVEWNINIPDFADVITYKIIAKAGTFSDGEEKPIPVLSNRMLVTESLPLPVKGNETKSFKFEKLLKSGKGKSTIKNHKLTLEFSSNPVWYAVQALPYIMESEYESADNVFNRYYSNSIASHLVGSSPKIKQVFDVWKNFSPDALLSNLEKNEELKSLLLQETPWVLDAKNESERKQRVALLFDLNRMSDELSSSLRKLKQKQSPNGGWPWFKGMPDSRHITQNIVTGFGHLKQLGVANPWDNSETKDMLRKAIRYLDQRIKEDYEKLLERHPENMEDNHLSQVQIQYLYARSYFLDEMEISKNYADAFNYYREQGKKYWPENSIYLKGMIALALNEIGEKSIPSEIMASIKEYALYSDELGMYWRDNRGGFYWYEAPIETQALLIEAFNEVLNDKESVEQMKIWLLKQKQTQNWKTGKATAEAVYALLLRGSDWLVNDELAEIKIGSEEIDPFKRDDTKVEAGTGYFKTSWAGSDIEPEMGNITVTNKNEGIAWGAVYWQYFENLDKITTHETPLKLQKRLFVERDTDAGPVIEPVEDEQELKIGDKIKVRIELRVDRDMEYVHMKDMRASAFEPVNVLSGYRYQGGLGYYESTLDASTNFFFDYLRKGTYVFEYPLIVSQKGDFSNGITTIQCTYAPEFTSHSEGVRVIVE